MKDFRLYIICMQKNYVYVYQINGFALIASLFLNCHFSITKLK